MGNNVKVVEIGLDDIEVEARLRMPDLTAVQGLAASIEAHGLMSPIEVVTVICGPKREGANCEPEPNWQVAFSVRLIGIVVDSANPDG